MIERTLKLAKVPLAIIVIGALCGLASNALRPDRLPLIRQPLSKTRPFVRLNPQPKQAAPSIDEPKATDKPVIILAVTPKRIQAPPIKSPPAQALFTTIEDARTLYDRRTALFLDARPIEDYEAEHIAGALSLYCGDMDTLYKKILQGIPKDRTIITYCSDPECTESGKLADALVARGHTKVLILQEGLPGWKSAGNPTEAGRKP